MCVFVTFLIKKITKCLFITEESYNFAPEFKQIKKKDDESQPT
jgi:hypothetical protein